MAYASFCSWFFLVFFFYKESLPLFKMHYFLCHAEKTFYPVGISDRNLGWIQPWHRNYHLDWGNWLWGLFIHPHLAWNFCAIQRSQSPLRIVNGKSKAPILQTITALKSDPWSRCESSPPIKWGLSPILKWKLRQMETAVNTARLHQGVVQFLSTMVASTT